MNKKKIGIGAVVLLAILIIVWQVSNMMTSAESLTAEEATSKVQELYSGDIVEVKEGKNLYLITIQLETGKYDIEIDRFTGVIGSVTRSTTELASNGKTKEEPQKDSLSSTTDGSSEERDNAEKVPDNQDPNAENSQPHGSEISTQLTEKEAVAIALKELNGSVDEVELESSGGITYYLVDIEREDAKEEATIQINAVSGEVMSIVWDD